MSACGIALALIPDHALDAVAVGGIHHAVEDIARAPVAGEPAIRPFFRIGCLSCLDLGGFQVCFMFYGVFHEQLEARIFFQRIATYPGLCGGTSPGVVNESDRDAEYLMKITAKEKSDGGEIFACIGVGRIFPTAVEVALQFLRAHLRNLDKAEVGKL